MFTAESLLWEATSCTAFSDRGMEHQMRRAITQVAASIQEKKEYF